MGNWRRVQIVGTCNAEDVPALRAALDPGRDYSNFHPLTCGGICGLPNWAGTTINAVGNLGERDYGPLAVMETLAMLKEKAPSLDVKVHCGDDYEADACIASVTADVVGPPEIETIPQISQSQMEANMIAQLTSARRF